MRSAEGGIEFNGSGDAHDTAGILERYGRTALPLLYPDGGPVSGELMRSIVLRH